MLLLVRHGRALVVPGVPPAEWSLGPNGYDAVWALRDSGRVPERVAWYSSPEPKALETAQLLTDSHVGVIDNLREQVRGPEWVPDFEDTVLRAFAEPHVAAYDHAREDMLDLSRGVMDAE